MAPYLCQSFTYQSEFLWFTPGIFVFVIILSLNFQFVRQVLHFICVHPDVDFGDGSPADSNLRGKQTNGAGVGSGGSSVWPPTDDRKTIKIEKIIYQTKRKDKLDLHMTACWRLFKKRQDF